MRWLIYLACAAAVMLLAFWAYQQNYRTQEALDQVEDLREEIARLGEERAMLRAEWAYLNRPDRLRELAELNYDRLGLMPMRAAQFGRVDQIAYPTTPLGPIVNPVDVIGTQEAAQ